MRVAHGFRSGLVRLGVPALIAVRNAPGRSERMAIENSYRLPERRATTFTVLRRMTMSPVKLHSRA